MAAPESLALQMVVINVVDHKYLQALHQHMLVQHEAAKKLHRAPYELDCKHQALVDKNPALKYVAIFCLKQFDLSGAVLLQIFVPKY